MAQVKIMPGTGKFDVNKTPVDEYFPRETLRMVVRMPLEQTSVLGKYDVVARVKGGGMTGQAGAVRHGISRALVIANPDFRGKLKSEGFLTRDPRVKERKKYGQKGARARFQFSKR